LLLANYIVAGGTLTLMSVTVTDISFPDVDGGSSGLTGVLAVPAGAGPWPGVVLVHEAFGVSDVMRRQVVRMAEAGYLALMPDLFSQGGARKCLVATFRALRSGEGRAFVDIERARAFLATRSDSTGVTGVLGFCMGGGFALAAASDHGFDAVSANYGMLPRELDDALENACPIVGSYGGRDHSLTGAAAKLSAALTAHDIPHDVKEYPDAGHSFLNDAETGPPAMRLLTKRILGAGPNPVAAADAWRRIEAFFGEHLVAPAPGRMNS
jgi:carboxymethylenebutenolidase